MRVLMVGGGRGLRRHRVAECGAERRRRRAAAAANPQLDQYKRNVGLEVDAMGENIQKMNDMVFSFARARLPGVRDLEVPRSAS